MKSLVFVILGKWNYGFNVLFCHQFVRQTHPLTLPCVTAGDGCDGYLDTATAIIKTVTAVTNCHGAEPKCSSILRPS